MATESSSGTSTPAPTGSAGQTCTDPTAAYVTLQCFNAYDVAVTERRKKAFEDMKARMAAITGIQVAYEAAKAAQMPALVQLLEDLKAIRKTVECLVTDQDDLVECFCKWEKTPGGSSPVPMPDDPCPMADERDPDDLEALRTAQTGITKAIDARKRALDELTGLASGIKANVDQLAAKVKELNTKICDKTIEPERAFVMQLSYRRAYVELRHQLTDPTTFVCRIYDLLDELFTLYSYDVCAAGAIAFLEKWAQLADEQAQGTDAESALIDEVLRCAKQMEPTQPPADDMDEVDELDPCPDVPEPKPEPEPEPTPEPEPDPYGGEGGKGDPSPTEQHPPTQQAPPTGEGDPSSGDPTTTQS
jgi:hypothetical protein